MVSPRGADVHDADRFALFFGLKQNSVAGKYLQRRADNEDGRAGRDLKSAGKVFTENALANTLLIGKSKMMHVLPENVPVVIPIYVLDAKFSLIVFESK